MKYLLGLTLFGIALFITPNSSFALTPSEPVSVEIKADSPAISPGGALKLGVRFNITPGWHIYGKDPGDSGLPTKIKFTLPQGLSVSEIDWPETERFEQNGGIVTYGYSTPVTLPVNLTADPNVPVPQTVQIEANVSWLNCSEKLCVPVKRKLNLNLPVQSTAADKINLEFFK